MPYVKTDLSEKWHSKLKHYRDENDFEKIDDAVNSLLQQAIAQYEHSEGELPDEYDKPDRPTWNRNNGNQ